MRLQIKKEWVIPIVTGVVSFASGVAGGYLLRKQLTKKNDVEEAESEAVQLQFELEETRRLFTRDIQQVDRVIKQFEENGQRFLDRYIDEANQRHPAASLRLIDEVDEEPTAEEVYAADEGPGWNWKEELANRDPEKPYIITRGEYMDQEAKAFDQCTITFYAGDNILCDDKDVPIYNPRQIIGAFRFGHGSDDDHAMYVRNETLMAEYEIILNDGYYTVEVLGEDIENQMDRDDLRHSKAPRKFRMD